jgi:light-regulated signal transduction histidine kinase (bacteriophytochrome)
MENLLGNAWKYTSKTESAAIEFGVTYKDRNPVYFVRDNGVGFDMNQIDRLFGVFQRLHTDCEFEGFGIGLATVQRIIQRHGGIIYAEGEVNKGATFYFTIGEKII